MADTALTGAWPIDATTPTGLFRIKLGDVVGTPHDPADSKAEFQFIGDATIDALLAEYPDAPNTALSVAMNSMATQMIASAQDIQVDDIRIKTVERAKLMLEMATNLANGVSVGESDGFTVVGLTSDNWWRARAPQGTPEPYPWAGF